MLLYVVFFQLCLRQLEYGGSEEEVVKHLLDLVDILSPLALDQAGGSWNILGALGFASNYRMSPRARFLALSLVVFVRSQITEDRRLRYTKRSGDAAAAKTLEER